MAWSKAARDAAIAARRAKAKGTSNKAAAVAAKGRTSRGTASGKNWEKYYGIEPYKAKTGKPGAPRGPRGTRFGQ